MPSTPFAIYGSHDSNVCVIDPNSGQYITYELERFTKARNYSLINDTKENFERHMVMLKNLISKELGITGYNSCFYAQLSLEHKKILERVFGFDHFEELSHHSGHAACGLYQSPFEKAIIISSDGGGHEMDDGVATFCVFVGDKSKSMNHVIKKIGRIELDVCHPYTLLAMPVKEIHKTDEWSKYLTYAGKIMGLAAYGEVQEEWIEPMSDFYYAYADIERMGVLGSKIKLSLGGINKIEGKDAHNLSATSQYVFEKLTLDAIRPFIQKYQLPIVLTGGAALNVLCNERIRKEFDYPVFVPVNPNDCGLAYGFTCLRNPPEKEQNIMYNGYPILDIEELPQRVTKYCGKKVTSDEIAELISEGNIIGVMKGRSEVGARALGHRSILCDPSFKGMKEKINANIKFREYFRPFAPVVRDKDHSLYFEEKSGSKFMSFAPKVRNEYREILSSIVHEDGTARVQSLSEKDNPWLYDVITKFKSISNHGVLLNTSLNMKGAPIMTTIEDALIMLGSTKMDYLLINDYLFTKNALV